MALQYVAEHQTDAAGLGLERISSPARCMLMEQPGSPAAHLRALRKRASHGLSRAPTWRRLWHRLRHQCRLRRRGSCTAVRKWQQAWSARAVARHAESDCRRRGSSAEAPTCQAAPGSRHHFAQGLRGLHQALHGSRHLQGDGWQGRGGIQAALMHTQAERTPGEAQ